MDTTWFDALLKEDIQKPDQNQKLDFYKKTKFRKSKQSDLRILENKGNTYFRFAYILVSQEIQEIPVIQESQEI